MIAGLLDAFPAFNRTGARKLPRSLRALKAWRRRALVLGVLGGHLLATRGARLCADGSVRSGVISLFEALDPAGNKTLRSGETCENGLPFLGSATASPRRSQAQRNPSIRRRLHPGLPARTDWKICFLQCRVCTTTDQSGISRTHRWPMQYSKLLQKLAWEQYPSTCFDTQAPAWTWLHNIEHWMVFRREELGRKQKACTGTNTEVESQRTTESCLQRSEHCAKSAKNTFDKSCLERVTLCIEHVKNNCCCGKRSPRRPPLSFQWALFLSLLWSYGEFLSFRCDR